MKLKNVNSAIKWSRSAVVGDALPEHSLSPGELARVLDVLIERGLQFGGDDGHLYVVEYPDGNDP